MCAYRDAYEDKAAEETAYLRVAEPDACVLLYHSFRGHRGDCMAMLEASEKEIVNRIGESGEQRSDAIHSDAAELREGR